MSTNYLTRLHSLKSSHESLIMLENTPAKCNGVITRFSNPILSADHTPLSWRYDLNPNSNPYLMERLGINAVFNSGAIYLNNKYLLVARVEGYDRKSFFAVAESKTGIDQFKFWDFPILMPETIIPDTNIYDMRLVQHEDGWIYGIFCTERRDNAATESDQSAAIAQCGIARTKDLKNWERLPDLKTSSAQQRNVVLHPEFVQGKYALYTRPQDGFIDAGSGGGIAWALCDSMENAEVSKEVIVDGKRYHTIKEVKNGQGPAPIKTKEGWLHLAHGVRNTAAGLRYVLYLFMSSLDEPWRVIKSPGGYFMAPEGEERVGDVSNVLFCNGWIVNERNEVYIYYASSDTRMHVALSSVDQLLDYVKNTPEDGLRSWQSVQQRIALIEKNMSYMNNN